MLRLSIRLHPTTFARSNLLAHLHHLCQEDIEDVPHTSRALLKRKEQQKENAAVREARAWHAAEPTALDPIRYLLIHAEQNGTLHTCMQLVDAAIALYPTDMVIQRLRLAALSQTIVNSVRNRAPWAAARRLAELEQLIGPSDFRYPYIEGLRWGLAVSEAGNVSTKGVIDYTVPPLPKRVLPSLNEPIIQGLIENQLISDLSLQRSPAKVTPPETPEAVRMFLQAVSKVVRAWMYFNQIPAVPRSILEAAAEWAAGVSLPPEDLVAFSELCVSSSAFRLLYRISAAGFEEGKQPSPYTLYARAMSLGDLISQYERKRRLLVVARHLALQQGIQDFAGHLGRVLKSLEARLT